MYNSSLKILRLLPPELSHTITINFLKYFKVKQKNFEDPILAQHLMGLDFTVFRPIGLIVFRLKNKSSEITFPFETTNSASHSSRLFKTAISAFHPGAITPLSFRLNVFAAE